MFEGATADAFETTFEMTAATGARVITFPDRGNEVLVSGGLLTNGRIPYTAGGLVTTSAQMQYVVAPSARSTSTSCATNGWLPREQVQWRNAHNDA